MAALPTLSETILPRAGSLLARTVAVHGDSHAGNVMRGRGGGAAADGAAEAAAAAARRLKLIDFDMTAVGPAGSELGFLAMMLFRCGFAPELVLPRPAQRRFAAGYIQAMAAAGGGGGGGSVPTEAECDQLLFELHCWSYTGCLKMGLLCAVLMDQTANPGKRAVMKKRGPTLLHPRFLAICKQVLAEAAAAGPGAADREALLARGLFFVAEERFAASSVQE
eukprot:SAG22_NODE_2640_length_2347_cov_2.132117_2_plen_222_part_00